MVTAAMKLKDTCSLEEKLWPTYCILKSRDITLPTKVHLVKAMVFPVVMYGCESCTVKTAEHRKNWCFWTVVLAKTLESPLDCKEIKPVNPKGNQSWILIGRTEAVAETPILWSPDAKNWLTGKDPDAGKDWRQEEKRTTKDEMVECIPDSMDMSLSKLRELVIDKKAWHAAVHGIPKSWTLLSDWTKILERFHGLKQDFRVLHVIIIPVQLLTSIKRSHKMEFI